MNQKQVLIASLTIALGVAIAYVLITSKVGTTSSDKSRPASGQPNSTAAKKAEPAKGGSRKDPLKEFPINDSFEFPLLGRVRAHSRVESVTYASSDGVQTPFPLKVYYTPSGVLARAEYFRPGAEDQELPLATAEKEYRNAKENIVSVPDKAAPASLQKLLNSLHSEHGGQFEKATKFNITYVLWEQYNQPPKPVFIINMFGTGKSFPKFPDDPAFLRIRYIFDAEGNMMFFDTVI